MKGLQLLATGGALPSRVVTNEDLRRQVDTSDEWITTRTGICQRYYCTENDRSRHCGDDNSLHVFILSVSKVAWGTTFDEMITRR